MNSEQCEYTAPELYSEAEFQYAEQIKIENVDENPLNTNATEDESMAVEALRELGNSAVFPNNTRIETKTPFDLPLLPCTTCSLQFRTTADLHNHSGICKHSQHKCQICGEVFDRKGDLNNHLVCHAVDRPHSCRMCGTLFIYKKDLLEHAATHGSAHVNQCQVCGVTFNRPSSLTNHMKIHSYQPGRAIAAFVDTSEVDGEFEDENVESAEASDPVPEIPKPLPSLNKWILSSAADLDADVGASADFESVKMEICEELMCKTVPLVEEIKESTNAKKPHACIYCQKSFNREKALLSHLKLHTAILDNVHQCDHCDQHFADEVALADHNCREGPKKTGSVVADEAYRVKHANRTCDECDKTFPTKQKLMRHMWIHRKKMFTCEICSFAFNAQEFLDSHRLAKHQGVSAYACGECGKNFSSRQGLWEHNRVHGPTPLFKCVECNKTFSSRQGYMIHKRKHSDERPYGCRFCWKAFRDGGTLRKHEFTHTGERPHVCPICTRAFNQKVVLREHVRWLHTATKEAEGDGRFLCPVCEITVGDKDELCAHIVKHSDQRAAAARDASKSNIKAKNCGENSKMEVKNVKISIESFKGEFTVECDLCGAKFLNKNDLAAHVSVHI